MPQNLHIRPLNKADFERVKAFTDRAIGTNYYSAKEIEEIFEKSQKNGTQCTLVLVDPEDHVFGIRITYPPGKWDHGKGKGLNPLRWNVPLSETAYFQSLFIDPSLMGQGWGPKMSLKAIEVLKDLNAKAIVCHSWKESPEDSSGRYLRNLGFEVVATHPLYWKEVDYVCTRCGKPCLCTAEEMIKYL